MSLKPCTITIISNHDGTELEDVKFEFDLDAGLNASNLLGLAVREMMEDGELSRKLMERAAEKVQMMCQMDSTDQVKH